MSNEQRSDRTGGGPLPPLTSGDLEDDRDLAGSEGADAGGEAAAGPDKPASESDAASGALPDQTDVVERGLTRLPPG
jgi:hypothetical protein